MSNAQDKKTLITNLTLVWPNAKLGRTAIADLEWLAEVATLLAPKTRDMSSTLQRYREKYEDTVAYSGRLSKNNGDDLAHKLAGLSPTEVMRLAERVLGLEDGELQEKYANQNFGMARMNSGNRIRAALKRGDITLEDLH